MPLVAALVLAASFLPAVLLSMPSALAERQACAALIRRHECVPRYRQSSASACTTAASATFGLPASRACNAAVRCAVNCSISAADKPAVVLSDFVPSGAVAFAAF